MKGTLYIQFGPKGTRLQKPEAYPCTLNVNEKGFAAALNMNGPDGYTMSRAQLESIGAHEIRISGFELVGHDRHGAPKYKYQEWYFVLEGKE